MIPMKELKTNTDLVEVFPQRQSYRMISSRRRQEKKRMFIKKLSIIAIVVLLVVLGVIFFFPSAKAKAGSKNEYETRIVSVRVEENDSLWSIAERFYCSESETIREYVEEIKEMNNLKEDTIYPDSYLVIRYHLKK